MIMNCSFYVKYYIDLHGFAGILAKKLALRIWTEFKGKTGIILTHCIVQHESNGRLIR